MMTSYEMILLKFTIHMGCMEFHTVYESGTPMA